jgi:oxygen-independent coproporphyrinogen-3 oxidase
MSFGLYLHVPFCEQHCHYCTFPIAVGHSSEYAPYVRRLKTELGRADLPTLPQTVYLGGGTPSLLTPPLVEELLADILADAAEVSIEVNPGTLGEESARHYRSQGINRVSLGAQSFDAGELQSAGRLHAPEDTVRDFESLRRHGFENINLDLIAGLPDQSRDVWNRNLDWVDRLSPDHVSIYLLELEDSAVWVRQGVGRHSDEDHSWFYLHAVERLEAAGYVHYETSSWARPGSECRHNIGYWTGVPYRGVGMGAHSFIDGKRFWNARSVAEYQRLIDSGELAIAGVEERTPRIQIEEAFLLGLRRMEGFDVVAVAKGLGIDYPQDWFERLERLEDAGMVSFDGRVLKLAPAGLLLANSVTEELLCPSLLSICEATR